jgi:mycothiol synthase
VSIWHAVSRPEVLRRLLAAGGARIKKPLPQLHMRHRLEHVPELDVPPGYRLRPLTASDVEPWTALLNENGELGTWTVERAARYFGPHTSVLLAESFFVLHGATPVATAQLELHLDDEYAPLAELGWVAVTPEQRGRGLGYLVCLAVLRQAAATQQSGVFLRTDDHRYPAIGTYLKLGFEPWLRDPSAAARWARVRRGLTTTPGRHKYSG